MTEIQHLTVGSKDANITVEAFINFACPYCSHYFAAADEVLEPYINENKVHTSSSILIRRNKDCSKELLRIFIWITMTPKKLLK